jgi:UDP-N-acetyl-2-amino-2-deoxyglucuronate dehydrogenase
MHRIKVGLVGCGSIGIRHAEHINNYATLAAVCDIANEKADKLSSEYNCPKYYFINDLLENHKNEIDLIAICTPNGLHAEHSILSLRSGINVLCEKPMALSTKDCEQMITEAEKMNKRLFVVKQNRFNPPVVAVKNLLEENKLGRILNVQLNCFWNRNEEYYKNSDWKGTLKYDGGILFTQFSHFIDLLYWFFGDIKACSAVMKNYIHKNVIEFEDSGVVSLEFENGVIGTINFTINSYRKNMEGSLTIFGEKGTVKIGGQYLNILEYQNIENYEIKELTDSEKPNDYGTYQGSMSNHDKVYKNVVDVLIKGSSIKASFLDGMKTVQIIERIYKSAGNRI